MSAFSSGAFSTDAFSVNAFDFDGGGPTPPVPPSETGVVPSGGFPYNDRGPTKEQVRKSRVAFGVIEDVAKRQAEDLRLDELQQKEELLAELRLNRIEARAEHFAELALQRQRLIDSEIARRIQAIYQADLEAAAVLIMIAAAL
jgi:hypothetical protein